MSILNMSKHLLDNFIEQRYPPVPAISSCRNSNIWNLFVPIFNMHYVMQVEELRAESQQVSESSGTIGRSKGTSIASSHQQISVTVVTEFVRWNEEAISRCILFSSQVIFLLYLMFHINIRHGCSFNLSRIQLWNSIDFSCRRENIIKNVSINLEYWIAY